MPILLIATAPIVLSVWLSFASSGHAQEHQVPPTGKSEWGTASFPVSCRPEVQAPFNRAVAVLHSFEFAEANRAFQEIAAAAPECAMAHWGVAASYGRVVWGRDWVDFDRGAQAIRRARALGGGTPREQAYIDALADLFVESGGLNYEQRVQRFAERMAGVHTSYPEDIEAALFYTIALLGTIDPMDRSYTVQRRAGAIAETVFEAHPNHPGAAHYVIHAYDYPPLANEALPAARRYAQIAPAAAHARHMPSHILSRLGFWEDSIQSNLASKAAAEKAGGWTEVGHTLDYMIYAHLQRAEDTAAARLFDELLALGNRHPDDFGVLEHLADSKARVLIETQRWSTYASIGLEPNLDRFPRFEAAVRFARGLGAARNGHPVEAREELEKLADLQAKLFSAGQQYYAASVAIWRKVLEAWIANSEGATQQALAHMRAAAELDDKTVYVGSFESGPDVLVHTREQLGDLLLELGRPGEALTAYEASLADSPNRFGGLFGAGRAAELSGDRRKARAHYEQLVELASRAESERPRLRMARTFLAKD